MTISGLQTGRDTWTQSSWPGWATLLFTTFSKKDGGRVFAKSHSESRAVPVARSKSVNHKLFLCKRLGSQLI